MIDNSIDPADMQGIDKKIDEVANDKGLSKLEINKNIYESIEKNAYKNN